MTWQRGMMADLAWAAGFLEGEGSFGTFGTIRVSAGQVNLEPLERLQSIFGGRVIQRQYLDEDSKRDIRGREYLWVWYTDAAHSAGIMMTLWTMMSRKRQEQIEKALADWKTKRPSRSHNSDVCVRGHKQEGDNVYVSPKGYKTCRICRQESNRNKYLRDNVISQTSLKDLGLD